MLWLRWRSVSALGEGWRTVALPGEGWRTVAMLGEGWHAVALLMCHLWPLGYVINETLLWGAYLPVMENIQLVSSCSPTTCD